MGDEQILIGNVKFYRDDVQSSTTRKSDDGSTIYSVFLKNGTKLHFYKQQEGSKANVMIGYDMANEPKYGTAFNGIKGLTIEGSRNDDYYRLSNCDYFDVDVKDGGKDEVKIVNHGTPEYSHVIQDGSDKLIKLDLTKDPVSMNEGLFVRSNPVETTPNVPIVKKPLSTPKHFDNSTELAPKDVASDWILLSEEIDHGSKTTRYKNSQGHLITRRENMNDPDEIGDIYITSPLDENKVYAAYDILKEEDGSEIWTTVIPDLTSNNRDNDTVLELKYRDGKLEDSRYCSRDESVNLLFHSNLKGTVFPGRIIE